MIICILYSTSFIEDPNNFNSPISLFLREKLANEEQKKKSALIQKIRDPDIVQENLIRKMKKAKIVKQSILVKNFAMRSPQMM